MLVLPFCVSMVVGSHVGAADAGFLDRIAPTSRIVRIEGHWVAAVPSGQVGQLASTDRADGERATIGELKLATEPDGSGVRPFAVVEVRSYHDADGGMQIFRKACLRPAVNLRGRSEVVARMVSVPDGEPITLYGQFATGSSQLLVSDVELPEEESGD